MAYFPTTHWSVVLSVGDDDPARSAAALTALCQAYWYPIYAYARQLGHTVEDAKDLTQGFFEHLVRTSLPARSRPELGTFRSFLLASFRNFRGMEIRRAHTEKRGGGVTVVSMDELAAEERLAAEPRDEQTPEKAFDRNWAVAVLDQAYAALEDDYRALGKGDVFSHLRQYLAGKGPASYAATAAALNKSEPAVKQEVYRMRGRFQELLRGVVQPTVPGADAVEQELAYLFEALSA